MMNPLIEFCIRNLAEGTHKAFQQLEKDPDLDLVEYGCLGYCGKCAHHLFALVNGEIVTAETPEELVANIYEYLEQNPMF